MIKQTFATLKENPQILLMVAIPIIVLIGFSVSMYTSFLPDMLSNNYDALENGEFMKSYLSLMGGMILFYLVIGFLFFPPLFNLIYEACSSNAGEGWYIRGLQRSWWKVVVTYLVAMVASFAVIVVGIVIIFIPILGALAYMCIAFAFGVFFLIALTSTIVEDDYSVGLSNVFKVGKRYFFRLLGTSALAAIPSVLVTIVMYVFMMIGIFRLSAASDAQFLLQNSITNFMGAYIIVIIVLSVYSAFAGVFLYTYSMHLYLDEKELLLVTPTSYDGSPPQNIPPSTEST